MVRRPVVSTAPSIRVKKRLKVGGVKAPANACSRGRAAPGRRDMRGPPCVGNMGTAIYLYVTSKGVRFVDPNRSREGSERAKVELRRFAKIDCPVRLMGCYALLHAEPPDAGYRGD